MLVEDFFFSYIKGEKNRFSLISCEPWQPYRFFTFTAFAERG